MRLKLLLSLAVLLIACGAGAQLLDLRLAGANTNACGHAAPPQLLRYGDVNGLALTATFLNDSHQRDYLPCFRTLEPDHDAHT